MAQQDEDYTQGITTTYFPLLDLLAKYKRSLAEYELKETESKTAQKAELLDKAEKAIKLKAVLESIPDRELKFLEALDSFKNSKEEALMVTKCLVDINPDDLFDNSTVQIQPADSVKQALAESFRVLLEKTAELKYAMKLRGDSEKDIEAKIKFNLLSKWKLARLILILAKSLKQKELI